MYDKTHGPHLAIFRISSVIYKQKTHEMGVIKRIVKPTTHKGKKILEKREPQLIEQNKQTLFLRGRKTPDIVKNCMHDLYALKKPDALMLNKKNDILPFENAVPLEQFSKKFNSPHFIFGHSNKKRPNSLIFGRTYHHQLLDMIELGIVTFKGIKEFPCEKIALGIKPCLIFAGEAFDTKPELIRLRNLFVDIFHRGEVPGLSLQGVEHAIVFTCVDDKIYFRSYRIFLKKSGIHTPRVEIEEIGPSIDFKLQRTKLASDDLFKKACKKPKELKAKKVKNISKNVFGTTEGRIHIQKQDLSKMPTKRMKGLRKSSGEKRKLSEAETDEVTQKKLNSETE